MSFLIFVWYLKMWVFMMEWFIRNWLSSLDVMLHHAPRTLESVDRLKVLGNFLVPMQWQSGRGTSLLHCVLAQRAWHRFGFKHPYPNRNKPTRSTIANLVVVRGCSPWTSSSMKVTLLVFVVSVCLGLELRQNQTRRSSQEPVPLVTDADPTPLPLKHSTQTLATRMDVVIRSFCVVGVAEIFDKTWFVALICALNYGKKISFTGGFLALALHVFLAAALGVAIAQLFSIRALCFSTAVIFAILSAAYFWEYLIAEPNDDVIQERSDEAKEAMKGESNDASWLDSLGRVFLAVFVAEWGDRTQVAMITLHSSAPWLPVCLGSLIAFLGTHFHCCGSGILSSTCQAEWTLHSCCECREFLYLCHSSIPWWPCCWQLMPPGILQEPMFHCKDDLRLGGESKKVAASQIRCLKRTKVLIRELWWHQKIWKWSLPQGREWGNYCLWSQLTEMVW